MSYSTRSNQFDLSLFFSVTFINVLKCKYINFAKCNLFNLLIHLKYCHIVRVVCVVIFLMLAISDLCMSAWAEEKTGIEIQCLNDTRQKRRQKKHKYKIEWMHFALQTICELLLLFIDAIN